jgi:Zn ribbon nucleic-acid-binding protein
VPVGFLKRQLEESWDRGWTSIGKAICPACLEAPALKLLAEEHLDSDSCDYCGQRGECVATDTDVVMTRIGESFHTEYRDPVHELPYESREGGYQGDWFDTYDLVDRLGEEIGHQDFVQDLTLAFENNGWCQRDYFSLRADEALSFSWQRFAEVVKHESRYLFLQHSDDEDLEPHQVGPADMLGKLGEVVVEAGLLRELPPGTALYRARGHAEGLAYTHAADLGTAPREVAFANRMSPSGIPLFYGALDADTAVREAWAGPASGCEVVSVGRFTNSGPLLVIDLASLPAIPSIFDEDRRHLRPLLRFLHEFADRISAPVRTAARSETELVEYIPTQVVSEYFRTAFANDHGRAVQGLLYRSAANGGGCCCALFVKREDCLDGALTGHLCLVLEGAEVRRQLPA